MSFDNNNKASLEALPTGWEIANIIDLIANEGVFNDGDWIESKDQDLLGEVRLIQLADIGDGQYKNKSARFLTLEKAEELGCTFLKSGDILVARMPDPLGRACIFPGDEKKSVTVVDICIIRSGLNSVDHRWLMHIINSPKFRASIAEMQSGTTRQRISRSNLAILQLPVPPLAEQSRIVAVIEQQFTRLDSAVASLQSAKARVKQYRASLLKSAVEGALTKEWRVEHPAEETGEHLLKRILVERCKRWEEAELAKMCKKGIVPRDNKWEEGYKEPQKPNIESLPDLPDGWCWATLEQCSQRITDGTHQPPQFVAKGIPFIFVKHIVKGQISFEGTRYISEATYQELNSRCPVEIGDILYSAVGSYGVAVPVLVPQPFSFQRHIAHIKPSHLLNLSYLVTCLNSTIGLEQAHRVARGVAQKTVTLTDLARFVIPLPPLAEQIQIVAEVEASLSNIAKLEEATENNLKRAEHERQSILQEAFAGRLVLQDMNDEPASVLLERIREERKKREEAEKIVKASRKGDHVGSAKRPKVGRVASGKRTIGLYEKLVEAGQPLAPDDLFKGVGLRADEQPESVEEFYEELHADVTAGLIMEELPRTDKILLYAVEQNNEEDMEEVEVLKEDDTVQVVEEMPEVREEENRRSLWDE